MLIKDYFPTATAPEIVREKIVKHIYQNKQNLSKRFYFYRVYAGAFVLLFVVRGATVFYNKELNMSSDIASIESGLGSQDNIMQKNIQQYGDTDSQNVDLPLTDYKQGDISQTSSAMMDTASQQTSPESNLLQQSEIDLNQQSEINIAENDGSDIIMIGSSENTTNPPVQDSDIIFTRTVTSLDDQSIISGYNDSINNIDQNLLEIDALINELLLIIQQEESGF